MRAVYARAVATAQVPGRQRHGNSTTLRNLWKGDRC